MSKAKMIGSVLHEYGLKWLINRSIYSAKIKTLSAFPFTDKFYEKNPHYPVQLDLFDIDVIALKCFLANLNEEDKNFILSRANNACKGLINGFSSIELDYGFPLDWQLNPLTGKRCDEKKQWFKIPDFDKDRGDIKVIWEASRFSHFITLSRAYLLTGDEKYYLSFSEQLQNWLEMNKYSFGANFKCSQECSLRMVNALLSYTIFKQCGIATDKDKSNILDLIDRCYRKVLSNFFYAYKCIKNNHTISELVGIIVGSWCCGEKKQLEKAYRLLDEVIKEQFSDDGGYRQFSFNYQRLALQDIECVLNIDEKTGYSLSIASKERIRNAALLMYQCQDESGDVPNYGSNDGALVFPVNSCSYRDFRPVINTTYALTTGNQLYKNGIHQEELIWFSGGKKLDDYSIDIKERLSSQFIEAGLFTKRKPLYWAMVVANNYSSRPAHMDQLHFDLWINGLNVLCDGGTFSYASDEGRFLIKNDSHNTILVDGITQMNSSGPFLIYDWTQRKLGNCCNDLFECSITSQNGYKHYRKVICQEKIIEIIDKVNCDYKILFHTPYEVSIDKNIAIIKYNMKEICYIKSSGSIEYKDSVRSLYYLKMEKTNCLFIKGQAGDEIKTIIEIKEN